MGFYSISRQMVAVATIVLSGCTGTTGTGGSEPGSAIDPAFRSGIISLNYSANSKVYEIRTKYDRILRAYGTEVKVISGPPLTGQPSEDAEVQNTIRNAFRAHKICGDGFHPGILQNNYGYYAPIDAWTAEVRCSDKLQANI